MPDPAAAFLSQPGRSAPRLTSKRPLTNPVEEPKLIRRRQSTGSVSAQLGDEIASEPITPEIETRRVEIRLEARAAERRRAEVLLRLRRDLRDDREKKLPQALVVLVEHGHDLFVGDRLRAFDAHVVVGDH